MKEDFILKFIEVMTGVGQALSESWDRRPVYKGCGGNRYKSKTDRGFRNLKDRGIIVRQSGDKFKFTPTGQRWFRRASLRYFKFTGQKWDKKWRVVIFDIPQELHKERVKFRRRLKSIGFYMLQKSVFIFPYSVDEELADICEQLGIGDYVNVLIAESAGYLDEDVRRFFGFK